MPENNLVNINKRITAATQTRKITRTMELIASSRLQRGKILLSNCQEWLKYMNLAAQCLPDSYFEPLTETYGDRQELYIVFGGSKGLSGAYGSILLQYARPIVNGQAVLAVGSVAEAHFPDAVGFFGDEAPSADYTRAIAQAAMAAYGDGKVDGVYMIYIRGSMPVSDQLLPPKRPERHHNMIITEPKTLYTALFEEYVASIVREANLQAYIAEQVSRISAMDSATRNADEIIDELQASYNSIRQSSITQEIIAVSNAAKGDDGGYGR